MFDNSIKIKDTIYAIASSGSFEDDKYKDSEGATRYIVKYDLNGNFISKHLLTNVWENNHVLLGRHKNLIIIGGAEVNPGSGESLRVGVFNIENNTFEIIIDNIKIRHGNYLTGHNLLNVR